MCRKLSPVPLKKQTSWPFPHWNGRLQGRHAWGKMSSQELELRWKKGKSPQKCWKKDGEFSESEANRQKFGKWRRKLEAPSRGPKIKVKQREGKGTPTGRMRPSLPVWGAAAAGHRRAPGQAAGRQGGSSPAVRRAPRNRTKSNPNIRRKRVQLGALTDRKHFQSTKSPIFNPQQPSARSH